MQAWGARLSPQLRAGLSSFCRAHRPAHGQSRAFRVSPSCNMKTGIVGLPNVGKSTLFNALSGGGALAANYPFATIEPNTGIVPVPDARLDELEALVGAAKKVPATVEFVDIAGLVAGAANGEGLGNQFLSHIRQVDLIVHCVRCFENDDIVHVAGEINSANDVETINIELALADITQLERRMERLKKSRGKQTPEEMVEMGVIEKLTPLLEAGKAARTAELSEDEAACVAHLNLLTMKPVIYAANVEEGELADLAAGNEQVAALRKLVEPEGSQVIIVSAQVEAELADLDDEERAAYLEELGVEESGLGVLVRAAYDSLGLQTYFTAGETEARAWTIKKGMSAPQAAGVIHSDFEAKFIRAETVSYASFIEHKGYSGAKEAGQLRAEGKEYIVAEGDVMLFRTGA
mmetsp:Transcript_18060/g.58978  ORF Transcript_18060/g.58978 Transcript_18060/m.58978 type:complete len:406 (-) Transcript_18060:415-1632(-)